MFKIFLVNLITSFIILKSVSYGNDIQANDLCEWIFQASKVRYKSFGVKFNEKRDVYVTISKKKSVFSGKFSNLCR